MPKFYQTLQNSAFEREKILRNFLKPVPFFKKYVIIYREGMFIYSQKCGIER